MHFRKVCAGYSSSHESREIREGESGDDRSKENNIGKSLVLLKMRRWQD